MDEYDFLGTRKKISFLLAFILSSFYIIPFFLVPFGWLRVVFFIAMNYFFYGKMFFWVSRMLVKDQRYDPAFKKGSYVRISRLPHDFEMQEILFEKYGYYEFVEDEVGDIVDTDGVFVWVETNNSYIAAHVNCLELMPKNYVKCVFEDEEEFISIPKLNNP